MGKNERKKLYRRYGGDTAHTERIVTKQQAALSAWIDSQGGAETVHLRHLSAIVAAKPKRKGVITKPGNPYTGSFISDYGTFYFVHCSKGVENRELKRCAHYVGGFAYNLHGVSGVCLPKSLHSEVIRVLSINWG